jgi:N-acetylglucosamine-6-phosphate deacetylase
MTQAISFLDAPSPRVHIPSQPTTLITHARLPGHQDPICLWVDPQGIVRSIQTIAQAFKQPPPESLQVLNFKGDWLSLGGVDLQMNGALGLAFTDLNPSNADKLVEICHFLWQQGIEAFLPTLVTTSVEKTQQALAVLADYYEQQFDLGSVQKSPLGKVNPPQFDRAKILGVHLEGPFLNPAKCGAHPPEYLQSLTVEAVKTLLGDYTSLVKVITLAPELDPTGAAIAYLRSQHITISLGHSQATAAQAQAAFRQGATLVTHAFNAMSPLHHRDVGLLGEALLQSDISCGLIADGQHICPAMLKLLLRLQGCHEQLFLVSDALAPLGLPDGTYPWDDRQIQVEQGTARLPDGTLAGTTSPLLTGVRNLVQWQICSVDDAIALATTAPRRILGDGWTKFKPEGQRSPASQRPFIGRPAHQLLRWHWDPKTPDLTWQRLAIGQHSRS